MTLTINPTDLHTLLSIALPLIVAAVSGLLRQDRLPALVNEVITHVLVLALACVSLAIDGKLSFASPQDLLALLAYTAALVNSPLLKPLQNYLQGNVFSIGAKLVQDAESGNGLDVSRIAAELAPLVASELPRYVKLHQTVQAPAVKAQAPVQSPQALPAVKPNDAVGG